MSNDDEEKYGFRILSRADLEAYEKRPRTKADCERSYRRGYADGFVEAFNLLDDMPRGVGMEQMLHYMWAVWEGPIGDWAHLGDYSKRTLPPRVRVPKDARRRAFSVTERRAIITDFNACCRWCDRKGTLAADPDGVAWHIDHRTPLARGGTNQRDNLVLSCRSCNSKKGTEHMVMQQHPTSIAIPSVDLLALIGADTRLTPAGREYQGSCPWCGGVDRFACMPRAERPWFICRQCGRHGDAVAYVRERDGIGFVAAVEKLGGMPASRYLPEPGRDAPTDAWIDMAEPLIADASERLLSDPSGRPYRYLLDRGLTPATIEAAMLGYVPEDGGYHGLRAKRGITIPLLGVDGALYGVSIRRPLPAGSTDHKYHMIASGHHPMYGRPSGTHRTLLLAEGYLDCLLAWQLAGEDMDVATLGLRQPSARWFGHLVGYRRILVCLDTDQAGKDAAAKWSWCKRAPVLDLPHDKDITDNVVKHGLDLRAWLGGVAR